MTSTYCAVCSEPWSVYHIRHDAPPWVQRLFRLGAGCEACEGHAPEGLDEEETRLLAAEDRVLNVPFDDDVDPVGDLFDRERPAWERPEDRVEWSCDSCGIECRIDADLRPDDEYYRYLKRGPHCKYHGHLPELEPQEIGNAQFCSNCAPDCDLCGEPIDPSEVYFDEDDLYGRNPCHLDCYEAAREDAEDARREWRDEEYETEYDDYDQEDS
ncbi:MAG: hypothetical protein P1V36_01675 [Planctomycetota bacterium]|nr:hypothetical protein [Planctomycetota bacterium]